MNNKTKEIEFEVEYKDRQYTGRAEATLAEDANWGADADGNRGVYRQWIDEVKVLELRDENDNKMDVDNIEDNLFNAIWGAVDESDAWEEENEQNEDAGAER